MYSKNSNNTEPSIRPACDIYEPVPIDTARLFAGRFHLHLKKIDSTNSFLLRNQKLLGISGLVVTADAQTSGRGRKGRQWFGIDGHQLLASIVIHPKIERRYLPSITLMVGLSVFKTLQEAGCQPLSMKWPNDILLSGKKVCGVLCELATLGSSPVVVAGIGLNITGSLKNLPDELQEKATTLEAETGILFDKEELLHKLLCQLEAVLSDAHNGNLAKLYKEWERGSDSIGKMVSFFHQNKQVTGRIAGLDSQGRLLVHMSDSNSTKALVAEEVQFI